MPPRLFLAAMAFLFVTHASTADVTCEACLGVARVIEVKAAALDGDPLVKSELVGDIRPRRRLMHTRSEPKIFRMLDTLCAQAEITHHPSRQTACNRLLPRHRDDLENFIFDNGQSKLAAYLCDTMAGSCAAHELSDYSGEL